MTYFQNSMGALSNPISFAIRISKQFLFLFELNWKAPPKILVNRSQNPQNSHLGRFPGAKIDSDCFATNTFRETIKKFFFYEYFLNKGGWVGIPKLSVKFWWPLFLAVKFTFLFLNLAKIHVTIYKGTNTCDM